MTNFEKLKKQGPETMIRMLISGKSCPTPSGTAEADRCAKFSDARNTWCERCWSSWMDEEEADESNE